MRTQYTHPPQGWILDLGAKVNNCMHEISLATLYESYVCNMHVTCIIKLGTQVQSAYILTLRDSE